MNILLIDNGSYSVKFFRGKVDSKGINIFDWEEVSIQDMRQVMSPDASLLDCQLEIIEGHIKDNGFGGKIIMQIPSEMITYRNLELPVNSRKKAEMMIPFALDENLPFPISKAHYTVTLQKGGQGMQALINIAEKELFNDYYNILKDRQILPAVLTSEYSLIQSYAETVGPEGNYAILDIGHETTKAYFIGQKRVFSNHLSHVAGKIIDDVIAETYQIPLDEAIVYKHENAFFLTDSQYDEVDQGQKDFALMMKQCLSPLVLDMKRWILGHRVKHGVSIAKIFISGGSSQIKNIENFLTQALGVEVERLKTPKEIVLETGNIPVKKMDSHVLTIAEAISQKSKTPPGNFLIGQYSSGFSDSISLHSSVFIGTRVLALSLVMLLGLSTERFFFLNKKNTTLNNQIRAQFKNDALEIPARDQRSFNTNPGRILTHMKRKNTHLKQEISTVQSALKINAVHPLITLSEILSSNKEVNLEKFTSENGGIEAKFTSKNQTDLETLKDHLSRSRLKDLVMTLDDKALELTLNYND
jgi:general secretion pathway protein L